MQPVRSLLTLQIGVLLLSLVLKGKFNTLLVPSITFPS
jgi:hypothetical protein